MKGQPKTPKLPGFIRVVVADNVQRRMDFIFAEAADRPLALSLATGKPREGGLSKSTIQRILAGDHGASIDKLEMVAEALGLAVYQLFIPMLDARSPYIVRDAEINEARLFKSQRRKGPSKRPPPTQDRLGDTT